MKYKRIFQPLDFVQHPDGSLGIIKQAKEGHDGDASVEWIGGAKGKKTAWWEVEELKIVDNLPNLLARTMKNSMSFCFKQPF